jgi:hypothetical protein
MTNNTKSSNSISEKSGVKQRISNRPILTSGGEREMSKSNKANRATEKATTIENQENEDLEVDEGLEGGIPEQPGNVPRF